MCLLPSRMGCSSRERDVMGAVSRHHLVVRARVGVVRFSGPLFRRFQLRKRNDSADTGVASVTLWDVILWPSGTHWVRLRARAFPISGHCLVRHWPPSAEHSALRCGSFVLSFNFPEEV